MKIAYIYDVIYPYVKGGAEKRFWELARRLSAAGHEVHVVGMKSWEGEKLLINEGVYIHGICKAQKLYLKSGKRSAGQVLYFTFSLIPFLWKQRFDIIDCNAFPYIPFFVIKAFSLFKRMPLVITWQEVWDNYWYKYSGFSRGLIAKLIERAVINLSDNIIACSLNTKRELIRLSLNKKNRNIKIISNGLDLNLIENMTTDSEASTLIFAGRLIKDKNTDLLIKALAVIKKSFPDIKCLIIGGGPEKENLISLSGELGLRNNVIFKGFLENEEVISLMKASRIFVFPSTREGFGIVAIEAMACGLPVVTVDHPMNAAVEFVRNGENGYVCKVDENDIAAKILMLLNDGSLRSSISLKAKDFASAYNWDTVAEENIKLYNSLLNKN